jgi:hypothetical protein
MFNNFRSCLTPKSFPSNPLRFIVPLGIEPKKSHCLCVRYDPHTSCFMEGILAIVSQSHHNIQPGCIRIRKAPRSWGVTITTLVGCTKWICWGYGPGDSCRYGALCDWQETRRHAHLPTIRSLVDLICTYVYSLESPGCMPRVHTL